MPRDWVPRNPAELIAKIDKFLVLNTTAGQAASHITSQEFAALATMRANLSAVLTDRNTKNDLLNGAQTVLENTTDDGVDMLRELGKTARGHLSDELKAQSGMTVPDTTPSPGELPTIDDLIALVRPNGNIFVDWSGLTGGSLIYLVQSRRDADTEWTLIGSTTRTDFLHVGAVPGVRRHYRVVPQRGTRVGQPSNVATVYA